MRARKTCLARPGAGPCAFAVACAGVHFGAAGGCEGPHGHEGTHREPFSSAPTASALARVARILQVDASELELPVDPPALPGDLKSELDQFTTVDACARQHAMVDPLVGDALEAIGYETFLRDACRLLDAAKARDARRCEAIDASTLRARCTARVAEMIAAPDSCPWDIPERPLRGRDPGCLAIASHDPRLCAAVGADAPRASCQAIAGGDDAPCTKLGSRGEQERCLRNAHRWRTAMAPADKSPLGPLALGVGELRVDAGDAGPPVDVDLAPDLERGLVIVTRRDGARLVVGPLSEAGPGFVANSPQERASIALELFVRSPRPSDDAGAVSESGTRPLSMGRVVTIERVELSLPGRAALAAPFAHSSLVATLEEFEPVRGAALRFHLDGTIQNSAATFHLHMKAATFVRDLVKEGAIY